jgi:hypothetical protein
MIYWPYVFIHGSWILGLSIVLAAFSYLDWQRRSTGQPFGRHLLSPAVRRSVAVGTAFVVVGFALLPNWHWWLRAPLAATSLAASWLTIGRSRA